MYFLSLALPFLAAVGHVHAGFDSGSKSNLAVYWGQNSAGHKNNNVTSQDRLSKYCENEDVDIFIISFITDPITGPTMNFANQGQKCDMNAKPWKCKDIGDDIKTCQDKYKKTILLSIGGQGASFTFDTKDAAENNAQEIWNLFGGNKTSDKRPFGETAVNGFDLDIEHDVEFLDAWASKMRSLMGEEPYYISAAPECPSPSENSRLKALLESKQLNMVFVQYYNTKVCSYGGGDYNTSIEGWLKYATESKATFFFGLPGAESAAETWGVGYLDVTKMQTALGEQQKKDGFGGAMIWDASQAWSNDNYHVKVKEQLKKTS